MNNGGSNKIKWSGEKEHINRKQETVIIQTRMFLPGVGAGIL